MSRLDRYTESLVEEGLKDAAETFFGARKSLEDEIARFEAGIAKLRVIEASVASRCATLRSLFPASGTLEELQTLLGPADTVIPESCLRAEPETLQPARGLTRAGRYAKTVLIAYVRLEAAIREYLDGVYRDDPDVPGKKMKTVHYHGLRSWSEKLNRKIARVNLYYAPSMAMQFAKKLNVNEQNMENIAGAPVQYTLDRDMSFRDIDFPAAGLGVWPRLPGPVEVKKRLLAFAREQYGRDPKKSWVCLRRLAKG